MINGIEPIKVMGLPPVGIWASEDTMRRASFCFTQPADAEAPE